jgi:glycine cleavage system H protein
MKKEHRMAPENLGYTKDHEWVRIEGGVATVGVTDHAQQALGDLTFVELPEVGAELAKGDEACAIESSKAAASVYAPVSGKVVEVNGELEDDPGLVNSDCYGQGWFYRIELSDPAQADELLTGEAYDKLLAEEQD